MSSVQHLYIHACTHTNIHIHAYITHTHKYIYACFFQHVNTFSVEEFRREWQGVAGDLYGGNAFLLQLRYSVVVVSAQLAIPSGMYVCICNYVIIYTLMQLYMYVCMYDACNDSHIDRYIDCTSIHTYIHA